MVYPDDRYPTVPSFPRPKTSLTTGDQVLIDRDWYENICKYIEDLVSAMSDNSVPHKGVAFDVLFPIFDNDGDMVTSATIDSGLAGGAGYAMISVDAGAVTETINTVSEIGNAQGFAQYKLTLDTTETNHDTVQITIRTTSIDAKNTPIILYPKD
jgi:hypothetical protein